MEQKDEYSDGWGWGEEFDFLRSGYFKLLRKNEFQ
jgi:hypothetical protein